MNALQLFLLALAVVFAALYFLSRRLAWTYARLATLLLVAAVMLLPFAWLASAAFKDAKVLNEYALLPPPTQWAGKQVFVEVKAQPTESRPDDKAGGDGEADTILKVVPLASLPPEQAAAAVDKGDVFTTLNTDNFATLFADQQTSQGPVSFWRYVVNSLFLASATTILSLVFSSMGGYALAKYRFPGQGAILTFMLASLTIPGVVLLAPSYQIIDSLGWMDTYWALLIPVSASAFGIFLFRQALLGVPDDLVEAGRIDGCSELRIYLQLAMPLVRPMTAAFCLITFLGAWNSFLQPNIFLQTQSKLTLPVVLNQYIGQYAQQYGVFLAGTLVAIIPPAVLFLLLQREFISGLTSGAVKQ